MARKLGLRGRRRRRRAECLVDGVVDLDVESGCDHEQPL